MPQIGEDTLGIDDLGKLGAAAALPLGRGHHSFTNAGTTHATNSNNVTFRYQDNSSSRQSLNVTKCELGRRPMMGRS
jgi:hypothetical protein